MPDTWLDLARDARKSAGRLMLDGHNRSCASRAYYAAYSKVAHELVVVGGLDMPAGREGPSHSRLRTIIETSMPNMNRLRRAKLSELVGRLYTLRIDADYRPSIAFAAADARQAISMMETVFDSF